MVGSGVARLGPASGGEKPPRPTTLALKPHAFGIRRQPEQLVEALVCRYGYVRDSLHGAGPHCATHSSGRVVPVRREVLFILSAELAEDQGVGEANAPLIALAGEGQAPRVQVVDEVCGGDAEEGGGLLDAQGEGGCVAHRRGLVGGWRADVQRPRMAVAIRGRCGSVSRAVWWGGPASVGEAQAPISL